MNDTNGQFVLNNIADNLIGWSLDDGFYPEIAKSWKFQKNGVLSLIIRNDLVGYDGKKMECIDILDILNTSKKLNGPYLSDFNKIISISCQSKFEITIKSDMSSKSLLAFLASPPAKIITFDEYLIKKGIGPFQIIVGKDKIKLLKNPYYYLKSEISMDEIELQVMSDLEAIKLYDEKKLNLILLSSVTLSDEQKKNIANVKSINLWSTWGIAFNQKIKPYNDSSLRKCLIQNTNSIDWINTFFPNNIPAFGPVPFGLPGYSANKEIIPFENKFLYKNLEVFIPKELDRSIEISEWIKKSFKNCLLKGNVKVNIKPFAEMMTMFNNKRMGAFLMSFNKETISDDQFYKSFYYRGPENFYNNYNKNTEKDILKLNNATLDNMSELGKRISDDLSRDAIMAPLMHPTHTVLIRKCISGVQLNPINEGFFIIKKIRNLCH